jgi:AraC-like DNA-binding protein
MASSFFIYFTGYYGFIRPEIFRYFATGKYERSSLNHSAAEAVLKSIKNLFDTEQPYLDNDLKLAKIAERLGLAPHHISQAINELEHINFPDFVNKYRVDKAIEMLSDRSNPDIKIFHVAIECGFNNKTSFNNAFKKITGQSPAGYRKSSAARYIRLQTP